MTYGGFCPKWAAMDRSTTRSRLAEPPPLEDIVRYRHMGADDVQDANEEMVRTGRLVPLVSPVKPNSKTNRRVRSTFLTANVRRYHVHHSSAWVGRRSCLAQAATRRDAIPARRHLRRPPTREAAEKLRPLTSSAPTSRLATPLVVDSSLWRPTQRVSPTRTRPLPGLGPLRPASAEQSRSVALEGPPPEQSLTLAAMFTDSEANMRFSDSSMRDPEELHERHMQWASSHRQQKGQMLLQDLQDGQMEPRDTSGVMPTGPGLEVVDLADLHTSDKWAALNPKHGHFLPLEIFDDKARVGVRGSLPVHPHQKGLPLNHVPISSPLAAPGPRRGPGAGAGQDRPAWGRRDRRSSPGPVPMARGPIQAGRDDRGHCVLGAMPGAWKEPGRLPLPDLLGLQLQAEVGIQVREPKGLEQRLVLPCPVSRPVADSGLLRGTRCRFNVLFMGEETSLLEKRVQAASELRALSEEAAIRALGTEALKKDFADALGGELPPATLKRIRERLGRTLSERAARRRATPGTSVASPPDVREAINIAAQQGLLSAATVAAATGPMQGLSQEVSLVPLSDNDGPSSATLHRSASLLRSISRSASRVMSASSFKLAAGASVLGAPRPARTVDMSAGWMELKGRWIRRTHSIENADRRVGKRQRTGLKLHIGTKCPALSPRAVCRGSGERGSSNLPGGPGPSAARFQSGVHGLTVGAIRRIRGIRNPQRMEQRSRRPPNRHGRGNA